MDIKEVLNKYFSVDENISCEPYGKGAVNMTYKIVSGEKSYILQKMNKIIEPKVMEDIESVTVHVASKNLLIQRVVRTIDGGLFVGDSDSGSWWRMLTYISGVTFDSISSADQAHEAGKLVGLFHQAVSDLEYEFKYKLLHYRDTEFYMQELERVLLANKDTKKYDSLKDLATFVLNAYQMLPKGFALCERIIHGDLKISNVIFNAEGKAVSLIDFDTLMQGSIAVELGDALRSWCMSGGEDVEVVQFDKEIYNSALEGYISTATFLTEEEKNSIPYGVQLITLELTARFIIDAFNENYWVLDASKYKSLFEQNKKRAENQFSFYQEFSKIFNT